MLNSKPVVVLLAAGLILIGFGLGQYLAAPTRPTPPPIAAVPPAPAPEAPVYEGPRPHAEFPERPAASSSGSTEGVGAVAKVLREPDVYARAAALAALLPTLGPEASAEVQDLLDDKSVDLGGLETDLLVHFWASHQPRKATLWVMHKAPPAYSAGATLVAMEAWATRDPDAALKMLMQMSIVPVPNSVPAQFGLVRGWFDSGRPGLEAYLQALGVSFERQRALGAFARRALQRNGPKELGRWAEAISDEDPKFKLDAFRAVASELVQLNPADAVLWCEAHCDGPYGTDMRTLIAQRWAAQEGQAAMEWVATAPEGQEKDWAVRGAFRGWDRNDRASLQRWVRAMGMDGVEPYFQPALELFAHSVALTDPGEAMEWAARIEKPDLREGTLVSLARKWWLRDEAAAEAWLAQSQLSEENLAIVRAPRKPTALPGMAKKEAQPDAPGGGAPVEQP